MFEPTIEQIILLPGMEDVAEELNNPNYANRQHGSRATLALNCNGPLCKFAERKRSRKRSEVRALREGREYKTRLQTYDRDDLLNAIIKWHKIKLMERRIEELSA